MAISIDAPIRVLLADDAEDVRTLLRTTLGHNQRFEIVGEAADGVESVREAAKYRPDVVVMDLAMPLMNGLEAIVGIRQRSPESKVVVLSVFESDRMGPAAHRAGADGYLEKNHIEELVQLLIDVHLGVQRNGPVAIPEMEADLEDMEADLEIPQRRAHHADDSTDILQMLAHELASPVAVIRQTAERTRTTLSELPPVELLRCLDSIARNAEHVDALIASLSDAHHIGARDLRIRRRATDVASVVRETVADLEGLLGGRRIDLTAAQGLVASVDPVRVRQVVTNLLTNAARYSPPGSRIAVEIRVADRYLELSVIDEGPGIPHHLQAEVFEKFSRLEEGRGPGGLGLGLYIARGIARAHGGDLLLTSEVGHGARFTLRLPLKDEKAS
jgi:signal transduction histidine kinase